MSTARHPSPQTSFLSDLECPLARRNSGAKQQSSLLAMSSSLEGMREVAVTALMKSSPFLLQWMAVAERRLCARRWKCMCCSPSATCFRQRFTSCSSNGPNSSIRFLSEQFLYSSDTTQRLVAMVTSAQMGRMEGWSKFTFSLVAKGMRLTNLFSFVQQPVSPSCPFFPSSFIRTSQFGEIVRREGGSTAGESALERLRSLRGVRRDWLRWRESSGIWEASEERGRAERSLEEKKSFFLLVSNSSFLRSSSMLGLLECSMLSLEDRMLLNFYRNLLREGVVAVWESESRRGVRKSTAGRSRRESLISQESVGLGAASLGMASGSIAKAEVLLVRWIRQEVWRYALLICGIYDYS